MSVSPLERKRNPEVQEQLLEYSVKLHDLNEVFMRTSLPERKETQIKPPPPPFASATMAVGVSIRMSDNISKLDSILQAGQRSEFSGADTLGQLSLQKEQLSRARGNVGRVDLNLKDSQAVLNRVSNWFNQFR
eukprot:Gregarina_sp_Poly_1__5607@NODE_295_length_9857_cov_104_674974_g255_i0_p6_GENE_NODE_295_length_9857_cov_104_674974_g255_i0NODE_295_length_9857_cov_104_674974_g255_i0_p6_ORF_typecomplete_len133_score17_29VSNARE_C/PF12352_8/4_7e05Laminin_I/PF06008_14/0_86Laminin_I/PF06008_14/81_NODE_295_length_9857_cov_104_674974_g255_i0292690